MGFKIWPNFLYSICFCIYIKKLKCKNVKPVRSLDYNGKLCALRYSGATRATVPRATVNCALCTFQLAVVLKLKATTNLFCLRLKKKERKKHIRQIYQTPAQEETSEGVPRDPRWTRGGCLRLRVLDPCSVTATACPPISSSSDNPVTSGSHLRTSKGERRGGGRPPPLPPPGYPRHPCLCPPFACFCLYFYYTANLSSSFCI